MLAKGKSRYYEILHFVQDDNGPRTLRKLPCQGDSSKVEFLVFSACRLNMAGGMFPKLSWGRSSLYTVIHWRVISRTSRSDSNT